MTLEDIYEEWSKDSRIDPHSTDLDVQAGDTPRLHSKYLRFRGTENMILEKLKTELDALRQAKVERLTGVMPREELERRGWEPEPRRILKGDVEPHLSVDPDVVSMKLRIALQKEKVDAIDSIMKMIIPRNFIFNNMIAWKKFLAGAT